MISAHTNCATVKGQKKVIGSLNTQFIFQNALIIGDTTHNNGSMHDIVEEVGGDGAIGS